MLCAYSARSLMSQPLRLSRPPLQPQILGPSLCGLTSSGSWVRVFALPDDGVAVSSQINSLCGFSLAHFKRFKFGTAKSALSILRLGP